VAIQLAAADSARTQSATEDENQIPYTSISGAYGIEQNGEQAWLVSLNDPQQRAEIPPLEGISPVDDEYHSSPNDEWIFGVRGMAHGFSNGDLFHRVNPKKIETVPTAKDKSFNDLVWFYCVREGLLKANYSAEEGDADTAFTHFVAWSLDSSRLLIELEGGDRHKTRIPATSVSTQRRALLS
jgi:hypothetical protein